MNIIMKLFPEDDHKFAGLHGKNWEILFRIARRRVRYENWDIY